MADQIEQQAPTKTEAETPADFLATLGKALRKKEDVDVGLVDILVIHLLTVTPNDGAVAQAKDAILKLADERATPPKPEVVCG